MKKAIPIFITLLTLALFINCWNKQENDVTRPVIPQYTFSGEILDYDSEMALETEIELSEYRMLYDVSFGTQTVSTDSAGQFLFETVYPGYYTFRVKREDVWLSEQKLQVEHSDTSAIIKIPNLFFADRFSSTGPKPALACSGQYAWVLNRSYLKRYNSGKEYLEIFDLLNVFKQNSDVWFTENNFEDKLNEKNISAMAFCREGVAAIAQPDTLLLFNRWDGTISSTLKLSRSVNGLSFHAQTGNLYSCSQSTIFKHNVDSKLIESIYPTEFPSLRALAYYKTIYSYDNSEFFLRRHDSDLNVTDTYVIIDNKTSSQISNIYDMSFDGYGNLWYTVQ